MTNSRDYRVATCHIRITGVWADLHKVGLMAFDPFVVTQPEEPLPDITIHTGCSIATEGDNERLLTSFDFEDEKAICRFYARQQGWRLTMDDGSDTPLTFIYDNASDVAESNAGTADKCNHIHFFRFGLWFVCNIAMAKRGITAIHSSAIIHNGEVVLFLGESGTGKSTHTRLWREHIKDATLLNDDSPFLKLDDGVLRAYGSPWSGKTHCYKNESYPVKAIVRLSQAPHNAIYRLSSLRAMGAVLPSLSPAFMFDPFLENKVMNMAGTILSHAPLYHLECLPDQDAALLSCNTIFEQ